MTPLLIFLGGGLGSLARYALSRGIQNLVPSTFPVGTLTCNLLGSFLIGLALGSLQRNAPDWVSPLIVIGFLGGFTTFSTFAHDNSLLLRESQPQLATLNMFLSLLLSLLAVTGGLKLAQG